MQRTPRAETCAEADAAGEALGAGDGEGGAVVPGVSQRKDFAILHGHVITGVERIERAHVFTVIHGIDA